MSRRHAAPGHVRPPARRLFKGVACAFALLLTVGVAAPGLAQRQRLRFVAPPDPARAVAGSVTLRVPRDPHQRPNGVFIGLRIGDRTVICDRLPYEMVWDSTGVEDGVHVLQIIVIDTAFDRETVEDEIRVLVRNRPPDPEPVSPRRRSGETLAPSEPAVARRQELAARVTPSRDPLAAPATALHAQAGRLYIGLPDGGVAIYNEAGGAGLAVRPPERLPATRAIATGGGKIWWLTEGGQALLAYDERDHGLVAYDLPEDRAPAGVFAPRTGVSAPRAQRVAWWRGRIVLTGERTLRLLDPATGALTAGTELLPPEAAGAGAAYWLGLADDGRNALLVTAAESQGAVARPAFWATPLSVWRSGGGGGGQQWASAGGLTVDASLRGGSSHRFINGRQSVRLLDAPAAVTPAGFVVAERGAIRVVRFVGGGEPKVSLLSLDMRRQGRPREPAISGSDVWWESGGTVYHADVDAGRSDAFLPWNEPIRHVEAMAADPAGVWVATDRGVRRIRLRRADGKRGYDGFVRARLGPDAGAPPGGAFRRLANQIEAWQGVPYLWGGSSREGTDCSGFVLSMHRPFGVNLPRTTKAMWTMKRGSLVRDELRYGDLLVYPGHCAIYIGDGRTAETVGGAVGKSTIWGRQRVVVRRLLGRDAGR